MGQFVIVKMVCKKGFINNDPMFPVNMRDSKPFEVSIGSLYKVYLTDNTYYVKDNNSNLFIFNDIGEYFTTTDNWRDKQINNILNENNL